MCHRVGPCGRYLSEKGRSDRVGTPPPSVVGPSVNGGTTPVLLNSLFVDPSTLVGNGRSQQRNHRDNSAKLHPPLRDGTRESDMRCFGRQGTGFQYYTSGSSLFPNARLVGVHSGPGLELETRTWNCKSRVRDPSRPPPTPRKIWTPSSYGTIEGLDRL